MKRLRASDLASPQAELYGRVRVQGEEFAVAASDIQEVIAGCAPARLPLAPQGVGGLLAHRGEALLVLCLRQVLELPAAGRGDVLVLRNATARESLGLLVDEVVDLVELHAEQWQAAPETLPGPHRAVVSGIVEVANGGVLQRLDTGCLVPAIESAAERREALQCVR